MTDPRLPKVMRDALEKLEPKVRAAFLDAISDITRIAEPNVIAALIEAGDIEGAVKALRIDGSMFAALSRALEEAFIAGGVGAIATLPAIRDPYDGARVALGFDGRHPRAEQWARSVSSERVGDIVEGQRTLVREMIVNGLAAGKNPRSTALEIVGRVNKTTGRREGGVIGLSPHYEGWVKSARDQLEAGDYAAYLGRDLRNKTYDRMIARAAKSGVPLSSAEVDKITAAYRRNVLRYRGEMIARTETITALRAGRSEGFRQLRDTGSVRDDQFERTWRATGDDRVRETHVAMHGRVIRGLDEPWNVNGSMMMTCGDPSLGAAPEEIIACRCYEEVKIRYD